MRNIVFACALFAAFAGMSQAATAAKPTVSTPTSSAAVQKSPPRSLSDATIERAIRMKLAKSKIGLDHFTVHVQGGVAFWEGKTDVIQHKGAATRMAKTAGAVAVVNKIEISAAARARVSQRFKGSVAGAPVPRAQVQRASVK